MKDLDGKYLLFDNKIINAEKYFIDLEFSKAVFEVLRVINGKILFFEDHFERLQSSIEKLNYSYRYHTNKLKSELIILCKQEGKRYGNIKIIVSFETRKNVTVQHLYAFFIHHYYPDIDEYRKGVKMKSYSLERQNPHIKMVSSEIREKVRFLLNDKNIFEILLIDSDGYIREGSKSNIFFIKENEIYTPHGETVLMGITRKYIMEICRKNELILNEKNISYSDIAVFDVAFITGTSPKVLPVNKIDDYFFNVENELLKFIMDKYEEEIVNYVSRMD